jgi:DNA-binding response OmpR family regulator
MCSKLLVIDDDAGLRAVIASTFARLGYDVRSAEDGRTGLAKFADEPADLVITDIYMPDVEGIQAILQLKAGRKAPKVVAISGGGGCGGLDALRLARGVGADATARKPLSMSGLVRLVQDLLDDPGRAAA